MPFVSFDVNGIRYACDETGKPYIQKRASRRRGLTNEKVLEKYHLAMTKNIDVKDTEAYQWLKTTLKRLVRDDLVGIGKIISLVFHIEMPREAYRRQETAIFWFHEHWDQIKMILAHNTIKATHSKLGRITLSWRPQLPSIITIIHQ